MSDRPKTRVLLVDDHTLVRAGIRKLLEAIIHRFDGGPVGLDNVAAAIGEESGTIEDVIEPYLIQQGFLQRTPRGRIATPAAWRHFGLTSPDRLASPDLFDDSATS